MSKAKPAAKTVAKTPKAAATTETNNANQSEQSISDTAAEGTTPQPPAARTPDAKKPKAAALPASVKLASPYAFYDDDNNMRSWSHGQVVTDPEHIAVLLERAAPLEAE